MKKFFTLLFVLTLVFSSAPVATVYAEDTPIDKISDWAATVGKDKNERDRILAERKAARMKKRAEKKAKKMGKEADKAGKDMKKKMGF